VRGLFDEWKLANLDPDTAFKSVQPSVYLQYSAGGAWSYDDVACIHYRNGIPYICGAVEIIGIPQVVRIPVVCTQNTCHNLGAHMEPIVIGFLYNNTNLQIGGNPIYTYKPTTIHCIRKFGLEPYEPLMALMSSYGALISTYLSRDLAYCSYGSYSSYKSL
jgi:hypothetical protein